jgi:peroxiredoxin
LRDVNADLKDLGATLVAVTPQLAAHNQTMIERHKLDFDMLSDPGNEYAAKLGLRFEITGELRGVYQAIGLDLPGTNGDDSWTLPIPARLVIDSSGVIRAADIDVDYTRRPEPEKTVADVKALG